MHHNWPYGFYAFLSIIGASCIFINKVGAVMGLCTVYVGNFLIFCRFLSEEWTHRKIRQEPTWFHICDFFELCEDHWFCLVFYINPYKQYLNATCIYNLLHIDIWFYFSIVSTMVFKYFWNHNTNTTWINDAKYIKESLTCKC